MFIPDNFTQYYEPDQFCTKVQNVKAFSYFHLNCRGLSANWDAFRDLLIDLHGEHFSFDIIGISEIFKCDNDSRLNLTGFHDLIKHTRDDDSRGGVGLFIRDHIKYKIR